MNFIVLERAGAILTVLFASRVWSRWRIARRERVALTTPLVEAALLEAVFAPHDQDGDDANLLAELRDTFLHLNRRAYAEEFWGLHTQIIALYGTLGDLPRATLRRTVVRLISSNDRWLQLVGANTASELQIQEAIVPLRDLLGMEASEQAADLRYRSELENALAALSAN